MQAKLPTKLKLAAALLPVFFITPWLIRNVLISGYLVFPAYYLDLFDVAWKMPQEMAQASLDIIAEHAKVQSIRLDYKLEGIAELSLGEWLPTWITFLKEQMIGWFCLVFMPVSILLVIINTTVILIKKIERKIELTFLGFAFVVLVFWFLKFPAIRFGWSWLLSFIVISMMLSIKLFVPRLERGGIVILLILVGLSWTRLGYNTVQNSSLLSAQLVLPSKTQTEITHSKKNIGIITIKVSEDAYCHGAHPPCQPHNNPYKITPLGNRIEDGFKVEK